MRNAAIIPRIRIRNGKVVNAQELFDALYTWPIGQQIHIMVELNYQHRDIMNLLFDTPEFWVWAERRGDLFR